MDSLSKKHGFVFPNPEALINQPQTCITTKEIEWNIAIPPAYIKREQEFIKSSIENQLGRHNRRLRCLPVGYKSIKPIGQLGSICNEHAGVYLKLMVDYIVFDPQPGDCLPAIVNRLSESHIGLLAHSTFNISINRRTCPDKGISIGDKALVRVQSTGLEYGIVSIKADLVKIMKSSQKNKSKILYAKPGFAPPSPVEPDFTNSLDQEDAPEDDNVNMSVPPLEPSVPSGLQKSIRVKKRKHRDSDSTEKRPGKRQRSSSIDPDNGVSNNDDVVKNLEPDLEEVETSTVSKKKKKSASIDWDNDFSNNDDAVKSLKPDLEEEETSTVLSKKKKKKKSKKDS